MSNKRITVSIVLLLLVIFLPYYFYLPAILVAVIIILFFWEAIVLGFLVDILYGSGIYYSLIALGILVATLPLRRFIRYA